MLPLAVARARYYARADTRHRIHLDRARAQEELWGELPRSLGLGITIEVDTTKPTDPRSVAAEILRVIA